MQRVQVGSPSVENPGRPKWRSYLQIANWPFAHKLALCPGVAVLIFSALGLYDLSSLRDQAVLIDTVAQTDLVVAVRISESAARLQDINLRLFRLTTLQAANTPMLDVAAQCSDLSVKAADLAKSLVSTSDMIADPRERQLIRDVVPQIELYQQTIDVFGTMLELDFASAANLIRPFDQNAGEVLRLLERAAAHAVADARARATLSAAIARRSYVLNVGIGLSSIMVFLAITGLLTRSTVRSVRTIATMTERVARGISVDVDKLARRDELGTIVQSLSVFQANVTQIAFLAHHDPLTRLPNRILFRERVDQAGRAIDRLGGFALLYLDLDRFKAVNDTLGHPVGDGLLQRVAERLQACVRDGDTIARLGGDEFAMLLLSAKDPAGVEQIARRIIDVIGELFVIDGHQIGIGTSIGIVMAPMDGATAPELLKNADTALYSAKSAGRGTFSFFESAMHVALQSRRTVEIGLRRAIEAGELRLYYQPLVDAQTRQVCAFEALIRWHHPQEGILSPDRFIPVAEASGLIGPIGRWVLSRACLDAASWQMPVKVAVNISPLQFKKPDLVGDVRDALKESGLAPERLEIEITESVLLNDSQVVLTALNAIKALGVGVAMDDFGTGYSSLNYLRTFPFDKVKIDRSFVKDLPHDANSLAIVRAIVGLSETFGMQITAEGVETDEQAIQLAVEDCTYLQGFLFSRPIPADRVAGLLSDSTRASHIEELARDYAETGPVHDPGHEASKAAPEGCMNKADTDHPGSSLHPQPRATSGLAPAA